jgi:hypothetical protein
LQRRIKKIKREEARKLHQNLREHVRQLKSEQRTKERFEREKLAKEHNEIKKRIREHASARKDILKHESKEDKEKRRAERKSYKRKRRRLFRYAARAQVKYFFREVRTFRPADIRDLFSDNKDRIARFIRILLNSTVLFLLSYLFIYLAAQAITVGAALLFHYPTIVYYYEVYFNIGIEDWYHDSVKTIYSAGPVFSLLISIASLIIYNRIKESVFLFKLFFLWCFLHGFSMFFGAILVGSLFETGIGHVISWMYVMDTGKLLYSIISLFMLVVAGMLVIRPFLISGNTYYQKVTQHNRRAFIWAQVILPYFIGVALLMALRLPRFMFYETFITFTMFISLLPVISAYPSIKELYFEEDVKPAFFEWKYFLILIAVLLLYRGVLNFGIPIPW